MADIRATQQTTEVLGSVSSDIRVTQQYIEYLREYNDGYITQTLSLGQTIVARAIRNRSITHGIFFFETIDAAGVPLSEEIIHDFTMNATVYDPETGLYSVIHDGLYDAITQEVIRNRAQDHTLNVSDEIVYTHLKTQVGRPETITAEEVTSDFTSLSDSNEYAWGGDTTHTLNIGQTIVAELGKGISDTLEFSQVITATVRTNLGVVSNLSIGDTIEYTLNENRKRVLCTYSPFIGSSTDENAPAPPLVTQPTIIPLNQVTLTCPAVSSSITLRNPELGDKDISQFQRINRETRGGTLVVFSDPIWPRTQKLILEFTGLTEEKGQEFLTFLNLALGQYVELKDWESTTWGGVLTAPQSPIIRDGTCKVSVTVEFEGGKLHIETITDTLAITQNILGSVSDVPWSGFEADKLYLQSGQFTSTLKFSYHLNIVGGQVHGIEWDGTDTLWSRIGTAKLYLQSGQFFSPIKISFDTSSDDAQPTGISWDGTDTLWVGNVSDKLYLQSGKFFSPVKDSLNINSKNPNPRDISWDGTDIPWLGISPAKMYLQSGQFTSTILSSRVVTGIDTQPSGISWNKFDTPWCGLTDDKLYLQSGQFTTSLIDSVYVGGIDANPTGISSNNFNL